VNQTRLLAANAVPTPLFALEVQRAGMPGEPKAGLTLRIAVGLAKRRRHDGQHRGVPRLPREART
jgi:hypothetical protein